MTHHPARPAAHLNHPWAMKHDAAVPRLIRAMKRYRGLALSIAPRLVMAALAIILILVVLPAALGAQASSIP
jgi:hypothetical protein